MLATLMVSVLLQSAGTFDSLMARGDSAYAAFDNTSALGFYVDAQRLRPDNYGALWKLARAYADVGTTLEKKEAKKAHYFLSDSLARMAVEQYPDSVEGHFFLAVAVGRRALFEGGKTQIRLSKEVKSEAERTLELDPSHDGGHHILGVWHYKISTLSWFLKAAAKVIFGGVPPGSIEQSEEHLKRAVALNPAWPAHHLELAKTFIEMKRYTEARTHLQQVIDLPPRHWEDPGHRVTAAKLLKKIEKKKDKRPRS